MFSTLTNHQFQVPLLVQYQLTDKRLTPYFSAGLMLEKTKYYVLSQRSPAQSIVLIDAPTDPQLKYLLGAGMRYQFNEQLAGTMQPTFVCGTRSGTHSYQLSLQTQLMFQF